MLINLDFLKTGAAWPPPSERKRLETYRANRQLFEDEHGRVYAEQMKRIERVIGNFSRVVSFATILNYQKLMSLKIADLIFGEPPKFTAAKEDQQKVIDSVLSDTGLLDTAWHAAIDVSRYGDGLLLLSNQNNYPTVEAVSPHIGFLWSIRPVSNAPNTMCLGGSIRLTQTAESGSSKCRYITRRILLVASSIPISSTAQPAPGASDQK